MSLVLFVVFAWRVVPEDVPDDARAVPAGPCAHVNVNDEIENMVITRAEIDEHDIRPLSTYPIGADLYIEGEERETFNADDETGGSRIWWRGLVVGRMVRGGSA
jgi:hypothetical protein